MPDLPLAQQDPHRHGNLVPLPFPPRPGKKVGKQDVVIRNISKWCSFVRKEYALIFGYVKIFSVYLSAFVFNTSESSRVWKYTSGWVD